MAQKPEGYFDRKGEVNELRALLRNPAIEKDPAKKREVIKRVTYYMTQGIDMSGLFSDLVMAVVTKDFTVKKLVYQYLCYYAAVQEDLTILVINTLRRDCKNESPMVRGLALRSLSSLRIPSVVEYLVPHINAGLTDASSYVRSAAVNACVKLFHVSPKIFKENQYVDTLYEMMRDKDATVAGNCVAALNEVLAGDGGIRVTRPMVMYLLNRLGEFSEWHEMRVLELLLGYQPQSEDEMYDIMNLLEDRFRHAHSGIMFGVASVFLKFAQSNPHLHEDVCRRVIDPLVTFLSTSPPEIGYVALCHARAMQERFPGLFDPYFKTFFFRYYDPLYIKNEKLEMLVLVANERNVAQIVSEVGEYCVDHEVSALAIRCLGRIALRVGRALDQVVGLLQELLSYEVASFAQVIVVVMQDLLRKYPGSYEKFLPILGRHLYSFDTTEAKEALIWILGEFGEHIPATPYLLEHLIEKVTKAPSAPLTDEAAERERQKREADMKRLKFQLLTAATKLLFQRGPEMQQILGPFLATLINDCQQADVRDRALLIYRTLRAASDDPSGMLSLAHNVFLTPKVAVSVFTEEATSEFKERIFSEFNTCSVVLRMTAVQFVRHIPIRLSEIEAAAGASASMDDLPPVPEPVSSEATTTPLPVTTPGSTDPYAPEGEGDLLIGAFAPSTPATAPASIELDPSPSQIAPQQFQLFWQQNPTCETLELQLATIPTAAEAQQAITHTSSSVVVLAAGTVGDITRIFAYARSKQKILMTEIQISGSAFTFAATLKLHHLDQSTAGDSQPDHVACKAFATILQNTFSSYLAD